jgi:hypothetical protein
VIFYIKNKKAPTVVEACTLSAGFVPAVNSQNHDHIPGWLDGYSVRCGCQAGIFLLCGVSLRETVNNFLKLVLCCPGGGPKPKRCVFMLFVFLSVNVKMYNIDLIIHDYRDMSTMADFIFS